MWGKDTQSLPRNCTTHRTLQNISAWGEKIIGVRPPRGKQKNMILHFGDVHETRWILGWGKGTDQRVLLGQL